MNSDPNAILLASWDRNATLWTEAVRSDTIASRRETTDPAIRDVLTRLAPGRVLDLGCGEGWLAAWLAARRALVTGIDGSAALIAAARDQVPGATFNALDFAALIAAPDRAGGPFDAIVANFSLLDDQADRLLKAMAGRLAKNGRVVIQTVHPLALPEPYEDGWRHEDFAAFPGGGWEAMPWYYRTFSRWIADFSAAGLAIDQLTEPRRLDQNAPASLLFELRHA